MKTLVVVVKLKDDYPKHVAAHLRGVYSKLYRTLEARGIPTPVGYLRDEDDASFISMVESYKKNWLAFGGKPDGYMIYQFDVEPDTAMALRMLGECIRKHCADKLDSVADAYVKRIRNHAGNDKWLADLRAHKGAKVPYEYVSKWYRFCPKGLGVALSALKPIAESLTDPGRVKAGVEALRKVAALLRQPYAEADE